VPNDSATALALEAEAEECPSERGEILLEAAAAWQRAGDGAQSRALLEGLVAGGGHDACYARVELAAQLFEQDLRDDALARIAELARDPALDEGHCQSAAELLAQHGLLRESLRWYDRFVPRLSPDRLDAVAGEDGWLSFESVPLRGRRKVRRELGLPPDVTDEIAPGPASERAGEPGRGVRARAQARGRRAHVDLPARGAGRGRPVLARPL
jgi:hypothetical protein